MSRAVCSFCLVCLSCVVCVVRVIVCVVGRYVQIECVVGFACWWVACVVWFLDCVHKVCRDRLVCVFCLDNVMCRGCDVCGGCAIWFLFDICVGCVYLCLRIECLQCVCFAPDV